MARAAYVHALIGAQNALSYPCREDADTVLELYRNSILTDPSQMRSEQELVDAYVCGMLEQ